MSCFTNTSSLTASVLLDPSLSPQSARFGRKFGRRRFRRGSARNPPYKCLCRKRRHKGDDRRRADVGTDSSIGSSDRVVSQGKRHIVSITGSSTDSSGNGPTDMDYVARQINAASMLEQRLLSTINGAVCVTGAAIPTAANSTVGSVVPESKGCVCASTARANDGRSVQDSAPQDETGARLHTTDAESGKQSKHSM